MYVRIIITLSCGNDDRLLLCAMAIVREKLKKKKVSPGARFPRRTRVRDDRDRNLRRRSLSLAATAKHHPAALACHCSPP